MDTRDREDSRNSRTVLERFLGLFADVHGGEGTSILLLALNVFLLLLAYYIVKPVREALILSGRGAEWKSYLAAGQAILLLGVVPLYGMLASRLPRRRLINLVTVFFAACLVIFYILAQLHVPLGIVFYLWVGIFSLMVIAQFWAFANDIYTPEAGKRVFAVVAFGASLGAVFGGKVTSLLIDPLGIPQLLLVAAVLLVLSLIIVNVVDSRERHKAAAGTVAQAEIAEEPVGKGDAFRLVFGNRYLLLIAFLIMFLNWVNTTGEYILGRTVERAAKEAVSANIMAEEVSEGKSRVEAAAGTVTKGSEKEYQERVGEYIGKFYGDFFSVVNLVALILQLLVVSRVLKYLGVRAALLILPVIALGGYALLVFYPVLTMVRWAKTAENSTDYSLQNTVRQVLFLPTTREQKYKAKVAIDTFFHRAGDVLSAILVFVGVNVLALGIRHFALVNLVLVLVWIVLAILIGLENRKLTASAEQQT